ncbi:hypothetical protein [Moraxella lacunata]|nr:hypothetical protein [Moraxella lacunata]
MILLSIVIVLIAVVAVSNGKISASKNHVFDVQCEIGGQIQQYQVAKIRQERGIITFDNDDKKVVCSQFFIQEIAK